MFWRASSKKLGHIRIQGQREGRNRRYKERTEGDDGEKLLARLDGAAIKAGRTKVQSALLLHTCILNCILSIVVYCILYYCIATCSELYMTIC